MDADAYGLYQRLPSTSSGAYDPHNPNQEEDDEPPFIFDERHGDATTPGNDLKIDTLDGFFRDVYTYHRYHGYVPYLVRAVRKLFVAACGIGLFFFFTLCVNWTNFFLCAGGKPMGGTYGSPSPLPFSFPTSSSPFSSSPTSPSSLFLSPLSGVKGDDGVGVPSCSDIFGIVSGPNWFLVMINVLFLLYLAYLVYITFQRFKMARRINIFYTNVLHITPEMIEQGVTWQSVVDRIVSYHRSGEIPDIRKMVSPR